MAPKRPDLAIRRGTDSDRRPGERGQAAARPARNRQPALALDAEGMLLAWERAAGLARPWAELAVLAVASGEAVDDLARLPIGRRDELLLRLQARLFGDELECEATCPRCSEQLELTLRVGELLADGRMTDGGEVEAAGWVTIAGRDVAIRLPDSLDVAAALAAGEGAARKPEGADGPDAADGADMETVLIERCVGEPDWIESDSARRAAVVDRMAELDPLADLLVNLVCPACSTRWSESLDPAAFLLEAIDRRARRLLDEVDILARAYGWTERDILALSPDRREQYLERALP